MLNRRLDRLGRRLWITVPGVVLVVLSALYRVVEVGSVMDWLAGLLGLSHGAEVRFLLSPKGWVATFALGLLLLLLAVLWPDAPRIVGEALEAYAKSDIAGNCYLVVLLRLVLERGDPVTVTDVGSAAITDGGDTLVGQLDRGDLSTWVVISERRVEDAFVPGAYRLERSDAPPDPLLPGISAAAPLVRGVHKEGWIAFGFPSEDLPGWKMEAELQRARSIRLTVVDALGGRHGVAVTQPWSQPHKVLHRSWLPG